MTDNKIWQFKRQQQAKLLTDEKCPICGDNAAKHVHYGAMTCFSCRLVVTIF